MAIPCTPVVPVMVPTSLSVRVDHFGLRPVRNVEAVVGAVDESVVPAVPAADFDLRRPPYTWAPPRRQSPLSAIKRRGRSHVVQTPLPLFSTSVISLHARKLKIG